MQTADASNEAQETTPEATTSKRQAKENNPLQHNIQLKILDERIGKDIPMRSEEHTSELQSH